MLNNLRDRIVVQTDGQMKTGRDVVIAALLGAEEYGFATAPLVVMGCIMMRVCHLDTCPVGIATQNPKLREKFEGQAEHVVNFFRFIAEEVRELPRRYGLPQRSTRSSAAATCWTCAARSTTTRRAAWTSRRSSTAPKLGPTSPPAASRSRTTASTRRWTRSCCKLCKATLDRAKPTKLELPIRNVNRTVGTILGSELTRKYGFDGLPDDTIQIKFTGSAGQSFGAFVPRGITLELEGDSNDYVGKGLSGGKIIVYPPKKSTFVARGEHPHRQRRALRRHKRPLLRPRRRRRAFCVRNSGAMAVVEGMGDHGCEYMTGGRVVVIGKTGRNFAAGMSGGIAFVYDPDGDFDVRCNLEMVDLETLDDAEDLDLVHGLLDRHASTPAAQWPRSCSRSGRPSPRSS